MVFERIVEKMIINIVSTDDILQFGFMSGRSTTHAIFIVRDCTRLAIPGAARRGRPKKTWSQTFTDDINALSIHNVKPANVTECTKDSSKHVEPLKTLI